MSEATISSSIRFHVGGNPVTIPLSALPEYSEVSTGDLGIPDETASATEFAVPFGSIAAACALLLINHNTVDVAVRFNGADANEFQLAPGGWTLIVQPVAAGGLPVSSASVFTIGIQDGDATVTYVVLGA